MRRHLPSTQALSCFEAAVRHESFTHAAQELALTQSAVSRQILALEDQLGVQLFHRSRHGVVLTPAGRYYGRQVSRWLQVLDRDTLDVMAHQGHGGALSLAAVATFATRWLIPRLPQLAAHHPEIVVHIETQTRPFLFTETAFDAALCTGTPEQMASWPGVQAELLMPEYVVPVCSPRLLERAAQQCRVPVGPSGPTEGISPRVLAGMPLLQQSTRPYSWRHWFDAMGVRDAPNALDGPRYELFSMAAGAAANGLGFALMPPMLIEAELARGELVIACDRPLHGQRGYYLVTPVQKGEAPVVSAFGAWLRTMVQT